MNDHADFTDFLNFLNVRDVAEESRDAVNAIRKAALSSALKSLGAERVCDLAEGDRGLLAEALRLDRTERPSDAGFRPCPAQPVSKYHREIPRDEDGKSDVYDVLLAFGITNPALQHAVKKLLAPGARSGGKSWEQDIDEAIWSLHRAKELETNRA